MNEETKMTEVQNPTEAITGLSDMFTMLLEISAGQRQKAIVMGFSEEAADELAMAVHSACLTKLFPRD